MCAIPCAELSLYLFGAVGDGVVDVLNRIIDVLNGVLTVLVGLVLLFPIFGHEYLSNNSYE